MLRAILAAVVVFATMSPTPADDWPGESTGGLRFFADEAVFKGVPGSSLVEFYILMEASQLQYLPEQGKFVGEMFCSVELKNSSGAVVQENTWTRRLSVDDPSKMAGGGALYRDVTGLHVPPGEYVAVLAVEDMFGDRSGQIELPVVVSDMGEGELRASDVILAHSLEQSRSNGKFTKSGYDVIPNTTRRHLVGEPLSAYVELYNLSPGENEKAKTFVLGYSLTDTNGVAVRSYPAKRLRKPGESAVKTLTAETTGLDPGQYFLQVEAFDPGSRQAVRTRRSVTMATGNEKPEDNLTEEQLRQFGYYKSIKPLASKKDFELYEKLRGDDQAQMKFLRQFWLNLDPTPGTKINERLIEHIRRMRHSDDYFSGRAGQPGSETEMGRVYIQYGAPDDVERAAGEAKPYEIWNYGRYEFVFLDKNSLGHFELLHSDYPGELNNPMWRDHTF